MNRQADDPRLTVVEPYHLLVVEAGEEGGKGGGLMEERLQLRAAGLNVVYTDEMARWRDRKVRRLRGASELGAS